eukprot:661699-Amphidinium_carterae.3
MQSLIVDVVVKVFMLVEASRGAKSTESLTCGDGGVHVEHTHSVACSPVELEFQQSGRCFRYLPRDGRSYCGR